VLNLSDKAYPSLGKLNWNLYRSNKEYERPYSLCSRTIARRVHFLGLCHNLRAISSGHYRLRSHTFSHPNLEFNEKALCDAKIEGITFGFNALPTRAVIFRAGAVLG